MGRVAESLRHRRRSERRRHGRQGRGRELGRELLGREELVGRPTRPPRNPASRPPRNPASRPPRKTARADGGGGRRPSRAWRGSRRDHLRGGRDGAFVQPDAKRVVRKRLGDSFRSPRAETSTAHASRAGIRRPTSFGSRRRVARDESSSGRARASRLGFRRGRRRGDGGAVGAFRHSRRAVHSRGVGESSPRGRRVDRLRR